MARGGRRGSVRERRRAIRIYWLPHGGRRWSSCSRVPAAGCRSLGRVERGVRPHVAVPKGRDGYHNTSLPECARNEIDQTENAAYIT